MRNVFNLLLNILKKYELITEKYQNTYIPDIMNLSLIFI